MVHRIHGAAIYGAPWIPSIYPIYVSIYTSTMDPMGPEKHYAAAVPTNSVGRILGVSQLSCGRSSKSPSTARCESILDPSWVQTRRGSSKETQSFGTLWSFNIAMV